MHAPIGRCGSGGTGAAQEKGENKTAAVDQEKGGEKEKAGAAAAVGVEWMTATASASKRVEKAADASKSAPPAATPPPANPAHAASGAVSRHVPLATVSDSGEGPRRDREGGLEMSADEDEAKDEEREAGARQGGRAKVEMVVGDAGAETEGGENEEENRRQQALGEDVEVVNMYETLREALRETWPHAFFTKSDDGESFRCEVLVPRGLQMSIAAYRQDKLANTAFRSPLRKLLKQLDNLGFGKKAGTVAVFDTAIHKVPTAMLTPQEPGSLEELSVKDRADFALANEATQREAGHRLMEELFAKISEGGAFSADFVTMVAVASVLAGVGLIQNNTVVIVASMLVSPIMGPVLAVIMGVWTRR